MSGLVPHALGIAQKDLEFCDIIAQNPEPIVYTLVISRKIMTTGEKPDLAYLRVFRYVAYAQVAKEQRGKLNIISTRGIFIGYTPIS